MNITVLNVSLITILASLLLSLALLLFSRIFPQIIERPSNTIRKFHHKSMIRIGGVILFSICTFNFFFDYYQFKLLMIFAIFFLFLGIISDLNDDFSAKHRLTIFSLLIIIYLLISDNYISHLDSDFGTLISQNNNVALFILSLLSISLFVNGTNLIDGLHGLKIGSILIICCSLILQISNENIEIFYFLICIISALSYLFIVNFFFANIRSGDTGAYYIGFITATLSIYIHNLNLIHSFHLACILSYPIMEVSFSYFRRVLSGTSPFKPDSKHIHSMAFILINSKLPNISNGVCNRLASLFIIILQTIMQLFGSFYEITKDGYVINFFIIMFIYAFIYIQLSRAMHKIK